MGTEEKTLFCYCRWGWKEKVLPDGTTSYVGGITRQVIAKTGIKYNDFVNAVFDRLGIIDPSDKILQFTAKFYKSRLIDLRDQKDVNALFQFNDGSADVYASSLDNERYSRPTSGAALSDSKLDTTHVHDDENDLASPMKKARCIPSAGDSVERLNQNGVDIPEGSKIGIFNEQASKTPSGGGKVNDNSDSEPDTHTTPDINHLVNKQASLPPSEIYKFSPSFAMTGNEGEGVPTGSFEFDRNYAIPLIPNDIWYPGEVKETENSKPVENVLSAVPFETRDKFRISEHEATSLETGNLNVSMLLMESFL